jgi:hypothetical protein
MMIFLALTLLIVAVAREVPRAPPVASDARAAPQAQSQTQSQSESILRRPRRLPFQSLHDVGEGDAKKKQSDLRRDATTRLSSFEQERRQKALDSRRALIQRIKDGHLVKATREPLTQSQRMRTNAHFATTLASEVTPPPSTMRQYDLGYNDLTAEMRVERDAALLNAGAALPVNCSNLDELEFREGQFASGSTVLAHSGYFRKQPVVIKKARTVTPGGHTITHEVAEERFRQEAFMLIHFRHAHHVKYLGGCFARGKLTNVVQKMRPWNTVINRADFDWSARLCAAVRLAALVQFWSRTPKGAHVHCDFFVHQFAFDSRFSPAMIDIDGLQPAGVGSNATCKPDDGAAVEKSGLADSAACRARCWKAPLWPERLGKADETLDELRCNTRTHHCVGFGLPFNVWSLGQSLVQDLFLPGNLPRTDVPARLLNEIPRIVAGMTHPQIAKRWTIDDALDALTALLKAVAAGAKCPVVE